MSLSFGACVNCSNGGPEVTPSTDLLGDTPEVINTFKPFISADVHHSLVFGLSCLLIVTCAIGVVLDILAIITFLKMGFSETINISYFALGFSDVGVLVTTSWGAILNLLVLTGARLPFQAMEISTPTMYFPSEGFEKATTCITAYVALERCLCVLFPLHVKRFVTKRLTALVLAAIFVFVILPSNLGSLGFDFEWAFHRSWNTTILRTVRTKDLTRETIRSIVRMYIGMIIHYMAVIVIWLCTAFLAVALRKNAESRQKTFGQKSTNKSQTRNMRVIKTVFLLAILYLCFSTPKSLSNLINYVESDFSIRGNFYRTYMVTMILCVQMSVFNSSINIFVYIFMSTKFRTTLMGFFLPQ